MRSCAIGMAKGCRCRYYSGRFIRFGNPPMLADFRPSGKYGNGRSGSIRERLQFETYAGKRTVTRGLSLTVTGKTMAENLAKYRD